MVQPISSALDDLKDIASDKMLKELTSKIDIGKEIASLMSNDQSIVANANETLIKLVGNKSAARIRGEVAAYTKEQQGLVPWWQKGLSSIGRGIAWRIGSTAARGAMGGL